GGFAVSRDRGDARRLGRHRRLADPERAPQHLERRLLGQRPPWRRGGHRSLDPRRDGGGRGWDGRGGAKARTCPYERPGHGRHATRRRRLPAGDRRRKRARRPHPYARLNGTGVWHADQAWLGHQAYDVLIEVEDGRIKLVTEDAAAPAGATKLRGWTIPGLANVHSHAFQRSLRGGSSEYGGGDFWEWRQQMYRAAQNVEQARYFNDAREVFREMLKAGITAVGEFHYLHAFGNALGEELIRAAAREGIRLTLLDSCYLHGGMGGRPLEGAQQSFSDGDADRWAKRMDELDSALSEPRTLAGH